VQAVRLATVSFTLDRAAASKWSLSTLKIIVILKYAPLCPSRESVRLAEHSGASAAELFLAMTGAR
jgi:hypothetical protein